MSKILEATCTAGVPYVGAIPIPTATILSKGIGPSTGIMILEEDKQTYIAKTSPDLETTLTKIASALGQIVTALTLIDAKPLGPLPPVPAAAANILQLTALQAELTALKEILK